MSADKACLAANPLKSVNPVLANVQSADAALQYYSLCKGLYSRQEGTETGRPVQAGHGCLC